MPWSMTIFLHNNEGVRFCLCTVVGCRGLTIVLKLRNIYLEERCVFCDDPQARRNGHYTECPTCGAVYTYHFSVDAFCGHVTNETPVATRKMGTEVVHIYNTKDPYTDRCSVCGGIVLCDGW